MRRRALICEVEMLSR